MMKYLTILLDDTSVAFCHVDNPYTTSKLIPIDILRKGIVFAMKENLSIQFVYPDYELPQEYTDLINTIDHIDIKSAAHSLSADIVVIDDINKLESYVRQANFDSTHVLRCTMDELLGSEAVIGEAVKVLNRINVIITDVEDFTDLVIDRYRGFLDKLSGVLYNEFIKGNQPQINIITDRIFLENANHCNAGVESITLAPNGHFYICPAFYYDESTQRQYSSSAGDIERGIDIKNAHLLNLKYAPICRICDAYQCKRCVWLNRKLTLEVNTPSHEQCVIAHLERNASRELLHKMKTNGCIQSDIDIAEISYMDPFDKIINNQNS